MPNQNIVVIGASGGLGSAFVNFFADNPGNRIHAFARSEIESQLTNVSVGRIDFADEASIQHAAEQSAQEGPLDCVIVATGILHDTNLMPEKSLRDLSVEKFQRNLLANTIGPALIAKHFCLGFNVSSGRYLLHCQHVLAALAIITWGVVCLSSLQSGTEHVHQDRQYRGGSATAKSHYRGTTPRHSGYKFIATLSATGSQWETIYPGLFSEKTQLSARWVVYRR